MSRREFKRGTVLRITVVVILLAFAGFSFLFSAFPVNHVNELNNIQLDNDEGDFIYNNSDLVFGIARIRNASTDSPASFDFWIDLNYFQNATFATLVYYNGTHAYPDEESSRYVENGFPDWRWWTESAYVPLDLYGNQTTVGYHRIFTWDEPVNTTIEYCFVLRTENESQMSLLRWEGNFSIRYSENQDQVYKNTYSTFWTIAGWTFLISAVNVSFVFLFSRIDKRQELLEEASRLVSPSGVDNYPSIGDIIHRGDALDGIISSLRTASSLLLGLAVAFLYFAQSFTYVFISLTALILFSLGGIAISLSDPMVQDTYSGEIDDSMLPKQYDNANVSFSLLLRAGITRRVQIIYVIRTALQIGVIVVMIGFVAESIFRLTGSFVVLLSESLFSTLTAEILIIIFNFMFSTFAVLSIIFLLKVYGVPFLTRML